MISINAIIFSNYMIGEVYCENRSHPEHILIIRRISAIRISKLGPVVPHCNIVVSCYYFAIVKV